MSPVMFSGMAMWCHCFPNIPSYYSSYVKMSRSCKCGTNIIYPIFLYITHLKREVGGNELKRAFL